MNTQNLISILEITSIDALTIEQLHNLLAQAYNALAELEAHPLEYLKMLDIRKEELKHFFRIFLRLKYILAFHE